MAWCHLYFWCSSFFLRHRILVGLLWNSFTWRCFQMSRTVAVLAKLISWPVTVLLGISRKDKPPGSETDFISHGTTGSMGLGQSTAPCPPPRVSQGVGQQRGPSRGMPGTGWVCVPAEESWVKESPKLIRGPLTHLPKLCPRRRLFFWLCQETNLLSRNKILSLCAPPPSLIRQHRTKAANAFVQKTGRNTRDPRRMASWQQPLRTFQESVGWGDGSAKSWVAVWTPEKFRTWKLTFSPLILLLSGTYFSRTNV